MVIGTFVVVNLFIAVVINNLDEAKHAQLDTLQRPDTHEQLLKSLQSTKDSMQELERQLQKLKPSS